MRSETSAPGVQKIDLHQNIINSFKDRLNDFKTQSTWAKDSMEVFAWTMQWIKNSWGLEDYKKADLQVVGVSVRPFEKIPDEAVPGKFSITYSQKAFEENLAAYEALRKQNNITLITSKDELLGSKYIDFWLNFFYKLVGGDGIKTIKDIDKLYKQWFRVIQFIDQNNNDLSSCYTNSTGWLTSFGKEIIAYCESKKIIIDVANMNQQSMIETYRYSKRPLMNSHTNVMSIHQDPRNVSDEFLDRINPSDGLIGLSFNADAIVGPDMGASIDNFMDQVQYIKNRIGEDQIALGSCYHSFSYQRGIKWLESVSSLKLLEEKMTERFWYKFTYRFFRENAYKFLVQYL